MNYIQKNKTINYFRHSKNKKKIVIETNEHTLVKKKGKRRRTSMTKSFTSVLLSK